MLTFFHSPGSCSDGILLLLEEAKANYEIELTIVSSGQHKTPEYLAQNPKGKLPALRTSDGRVLTEFQSIAFWLANRFEGSGLWPKDVDQQQRVLEVMDYIVGSIHMRGLTFVKAAKRFQLDERGTQDLYRFGRSEVEKGLRNLSEILGSQTYLVDTFSPADAAAFYALRWSEAEGFTLPNNLDELLARIRKRPATLRAFSS